VSRMLTNKDAQLIDGALAQSANGSGARVQSANGGDGFKLTSIGDALAEPIEEAEWLIDGLLSAGGISIWVAKPFGGKSTALRAAALKVSRGEPFLGRTTSKGAVGYFALEQARNEVVGHFKQMGATRADSATLKIHTGMVPAEDVTEKLRQVIVENSLKLAVIDPVVLLLIRGVRDFNEYAAVYAALEPLISIARDTGCHMALVHHLSKAERDSMDQIMGSTAFSGAADTVVTLRKKVEGGVEFRTIEAQQRRAGVNMQPTTLTLDMVTGFVGIGEPLWLKKKEAAFETVLAFLRQQSDQQFLNDELRKKLGLKKATVDAALKRGIDEKSVERSGSGNKGDAFRYRAKSDSGARNAPPSKSKPKLEVVKKRKFAK
jgi:hypothetical protein